MNNVVVIPDFYTPEECKAELWYAERTGFKEQKYGVTHTTEARRRAYVDDSERAAKIYSKLKLPPTGNVL